MAVEAYEYTTRRIDLSDLFLVDQGIAEMADDGWEFVSANGNVHYFKRVKAEL